MKAINSLLFLFLAYSISWGQHPGLEEQGWKQSGDSYYFNLSPGSMSERFPADLFIDRLKKELGFDVNDNLILANDFVDHLGISHYRFVQTYADIIVVGGGLMLHGDSKGIQKANGKLFAGVNLQFPVSFTEAEAILVARKSSKGENVQIENIELCVLPGSMIERKRISNLCYRIRMHSDQLLDESELYVDAHTGKVILSVPLVCLGDEEGTANTLYSGSRQITTDFNGGNYRLKESSRPLHTLNLNHAIDLGSVTEFTDDDNLWTNSITVLRHVTINKLGSGWWQDVPGDDDPDIYLVIKDGSNATVATTSTMMDVALPVSIPLQLTLTNPPYSISIFEDDGGSDDWGGPFNVSTSLGMKSFSILGNMGTYETVQQNDPALDAHWGVEQTYDYFKNIHNRDSYDDQGSEIVSYVHFAIGWPNAFWSNNSLKLGDGDGISTTYRTYINVVSHEISHGVINNNGGGGLQYEGESGALSESFADIFGTAVEHYAKPATADWLHGEEGSLIPGEYIRSMEDPRAKNQPDTYGSKDSYWADPLDITVDFGGVHTNSGVQNYWFYLLSEGGSGVNENGYAYIVDGIGLEKAEQIAYRNLTQYISASTTSNFMDSRMGSIMAAEDLFGPGSPEVLSVQKAWAAVGVGTFDPGPTCDGLVYLTDPSGAVSDGSGMFDYGNNGFCSWLIDPESANSIEIKFLDFNLAFGDTLWIYDGGDFNSPVLAALTGNSLPIDLVSSDGILFLYFVTDGSVTAEGWSFDYTSSSIAYCMGLKTLTDVEGDLEDGSGIDNYGNASDCSWLIQPLNAKDITLTFTSFVTEDGNDIVTVYDGDDAASPLLGTFSGASIPGPIIGTGESMFIQFTSNSIVRLDGWTASYTSKEITAIDDEDAVHELRILPNPTSGQFSLHLPKWSGPESTLLILNAIGQQIGEMTIEPGSAMVTMDLSQKPSGLYHLIWFAGKQWFAGNVVVR